jgi:hypothetical protein
MFAIEKGNPGFENYGMALWWTSMRVITAGSDFWPVTPEGRGAGIYSFTFWVCNFWLRNLHTGYFFY